MATIGDSISRIIRVLQDGSKTNYQVPELSQYFNLAISFISRELAKWHSRIGLTNTILTYSAGDYSEALPSDFLALAVNDDGDYRIFNVTNSYARLDRAEVYEMDDWESETASDDGTVDHFIIDGTNMVVHPRPDVSTQVKFYYHPLNSIVDDSSTMPWSGWFSEPIEQFVMRQCHLRSEQGGYLQVDIADYDRLSKHCWDLLRQREGNKFSMTPVIGWND